MCSYPLREEQGCGARTYSRFRGNHQGILTYFSLQSCRRLLFVWNMPARATCRERPVAGEAGLRKGNEERAIKSRYPLEFPTTLTSVARGSQK